MKYLLTLLVAIIGLTTVAFCIETNGVVSIDIPWSNEKNIEIFENVCPNNRTKCTERQTCCATKHHSYHCCRYPNAVCCPDKFHCCPHGSTCDVKRKKCNRRSDIPIIPMKPQLQPMEWPVIDETLKVEPNQQTCPNNRTKCKDSQTCCETKHHSYHCCKYENAVCCPDKFHCCPEDSTCDMRRRRCVKSTVEMFKLTPSKVMLGSEQEKPILEAGADLKNGNDDITCPNNKTKCKDTKTCCITKHGNYYCCPHKNAVCCSDKYQCCPESTTCDLKNKKCIKSFPISVGGSSNNPHNLHLSSLVYHPKDYKYCPDQKAKCPGKKNCCPLYTGNFGCCPFNHGVCCPDLKTCCPHDTQCDVKKNQCSTPNKSIIPITATISRKSKLGTDICPDNVSECFSWQTCCLAEDNSYGCCPYQNAVCCADKTSCCRANHKCDLKTSSCIPQDKHEYFQTDKTNERLSLISFFNNANLGNICSNKDKCPNNHTCCSIGDNRNGCCPYASGVCCADFKTCCPNGKKCTINGCQ